MSLRKFGLFVLLVLVSGCASGGLGVSQDIELDDAQGAKRWKLEPDAEGVELEDANSEEIGSFKLDGPHRIRAKDASGARYVIARAGAEITVHQDGAVVYRLQREPDGDYSLVAGETELYAIKARDYGFKVLDAAARETKVRSKKGKVSIRNEEGDTILSTRDPLPTLAAACFVFDELPETVRAGLALGVMAWGM